VTTRQVEQLLKLLNTVNYLQVHLANPEVLIHLENMVNRVNQMGPANPEVQAALTNLVNSANPVNLENSENHPDP
jgi:hypothetical protein